MWDAVSFIAVCDERCVAVCDERTSLQEIINFDRKKCACDGQFGCLVV